jgi:ribosome maturation protein Sdo1
MPSEQLMYTSHLELHNPVTMVLLVDEEMLEKYKRGDAGVTTSHVVDSFNVFKYKTGKQGDMSHPSKTELEAIFDTTDMEEVVEFMLENGKLRPKSSQKEDTTDGKLLHSKKQDAAGLHSRKHVPHSRPL